MMKDCPLASHGLPAQVLIRIVPPEAPQSKRVQVTVHS